MVCDEPTSALDVSVQAAILNLLVDLQASKETSYVFISHDLGVVRYLSDRIAVLYLGRLMELGPAETVFDPPHHPYTEALLSAVPTIDGAQRTRIELPGEIPSAADPPSGCVFHTRCPRFLGTICETEEPPLAEVEPGHLMRCHIPIEELRAAQTKRRDARPGMTVRAAVLAEVGAELEVVELDLAPPRAEEVRVRLHASGVCHSDWNAIDGTAPTRCPAVLGHEGAGVVEAVGPGVERIGVGDHVALSWAPWCGRCDGVPPRPAMALLDRLAGNGHRRADGRDHAALARRRARLPLLVPLDVRRGVRRARALLRPDPRDVPFEIAGLVGCAVTTGVGAVWRTAGRAARRSCRRDRMRRRRSFRADGRRSRSARSP